MHRVDSNVFVYHSLNDGNLYKHDAAINDSKVVMDESIFVRFHFVLFSFFLLLCFCAWSRNIIRRSTSSLFLMFGNIDILI